MDNGFGRTTRILVLFLVWSVTPVISSLGGENDVADKRVVEIVDGLRARLGIAEAVSVKIVPANRLFFSVEPADSRAHFLLTVDGSFLSGLSDQELSAAVAHELGHVWIYTHHPFLHTEALANSVALRAVTRDSLMRLYDKMWKAEGIHGDYQTVGLLSADLP